MVVKPIPNAKSAVGWFSEGEEIFVLAIRNVAQHSSFLLWSKTQSSAALFPSSDFNIIDNRIPALWRASSDGNGNIEFAIEDWLVEGFWERFHEEEREAVANFRAGMKALISSIDANLL